MIDLVDSGGSSGLNGVWSDRAVFGSADDACEAEREREERPFD